MNYSRRMIEAQIEHRMKRKGISRKQAINEMMRGATRGAREAERSVDLAQIALAQARLDGDKMRIQLAKSSIASNGSLASREHHRIATLREIAEEGSRGAD